MDFARAAGDGLRLAVRLTPRADADRLDGPRTLSDGRTVLAVRVRAAAQKGAANDALEVLLARALGVPKGTVAVTGGRTGRLKTVRVAGDPADLAARLETGMER